jgi:NAD(P)-dependent dehydrogenase (short-subunit alcohol dehydrogenase family)
MPTAVLTGASRGFGLATARALVERGWTVIGDARDGEALASAATSVAGGAGDRMVAVPGDVTDAEHRGRLVAEVASAGRLDLLINNASVLGGSPPPRLEQLQLEAFRHVLEVNTLAPTALLSALVPVLRSSAGVAVNVTSDVAVEAAAGWGAYAASKAALEAITATAAAEHPEVRFYGLDPGDMRTTMHQAAFPDEDISDRPEPGSVVPALLWLLDERPPSGRYVASELPTTAVAS